MRVLHVISTVAERYGGPSAAIRGMCEALASRGADVTVATTDADGLRRLNVPLHRPVIERGVEYRYFKRASYSTHWHFSPALTRWLAEATASFDVVEAHALFTYTTIPATRFASRRKVPYVIRPLGTLAGWSLAQKAWKKRPYYALIERRTLAGAAAIHVTAESEAAELRALGFGTTTRVIPLGVDVLNAPRNPGPADGPLRMLFLSRLHKKKGLEMLFEAVALMCKGGSASGITLTIAGDGEPEYIRALDSEVVRHRIGDVVRFVGPLTGGLKREAFENADVFVLPSYNENFGIAAAEAMAVGIPVILSHDVGLSSAVAAHEAGIAVARDPIAIANAIVKMRDNYSLRQKMGVNAWRYARDHLSWAESARRLIDLYTEISSTKVRAF